MPQIHENTETAVANEALSCVKQPQLIDLDGDATNPARIVKKHFASVRDGLLRRYPWNFATTRATLSAQSQAPAFGYARSCALPEDCLRVLQLPDASSRDDWKVEGRAILTDLSAPLKVIYTRRAHEVASWDALFRFAFARLLAVAIGPELSALKEDLEKASQEASTALASAFASDAAEGTSDDLPDGDWLDARR